jgi:hypothetical protein
MSLYAVQRGVEADESDEVLYDGWRHLELAQQLWSLVDETRAHDLDDLLARVEGRTGSRCALLDPTSMRPFRC